MRNYQLVLVLKTSLTDANKKKVLENVKSLLKGAKFDKEEDLGEKNLSYPIKRETKGLYYNYLFEAENDIAKDLDKRITANEDILRHLLLRK